MYLTLLLRTLGHASKNSTVLRKICTYSYIVYNMILLYYNSQLHLYNRKHRAAR
jgi:hypothetical protein